MTIPLLRTKPPIVIHWHSDVVGLNLPYRLYKLLEKRLLDCAATIIVTSRDYLESSLPLRAFIDKSQILPLGMNPERLKECADPPRYIAGWLNGYKYILSVGRLTYYKGYEYLIEAFRYLDDTKLIIVGDGKQKPKLLGLIHKLNLGSKVLLPGYLPDPEKSYLLKNCLAFCLPSSERTEAFGISILEAMYFGKPIITARIEGSGVNFVNKQGLTGLIAEPRDPKSLAAAIRHLLDSEHLVQLFGKNSRARFYEHFHIRNIARKMRTIYENTHTHTCKK